MSTSFQNLRLKSLLEADGVLRELGFDVECDATGGLMISRRNHVRGLWHHDGQNFIWFPAGYNAAAFIAATANEALRFTLEQIVPRPTGGPAPKNMPLQ